MTQSPLFTLLSQAWIAFTIEVDNDVEGRLPHRTTLAGAGSAPSSRLWLVSSTIWTNFLQFVDDDGTTVRTFQERTGLSSEHVKIWLTRLSRWWGYLSVTPEQLVRFTPEGRRAAGLWRSLFPLVEERWRTRFGEATIDSLRAQLTSLAHAVDSKATGYLPVLGYGLFSKVDERYREAPAAEEGAISGGALPALLAQVLLAFALEFEREAKLSLPVVANVLRVLGNGEMRVRDLAQLTGTAKEAVAVSVAFLTRSGYATVGSDRAGGRTRVVTLTQQGQDAHAAAARRLSDIAAGWKTRLGDGGITTLHDGLAELMERRASARPVLSEGLLPAPGGWRTAKTYAPQTAAMLNDPATLPHFPMILHRGGWPDGS